MQSAHVNEMAVSSTSEDRPDVLVEVARDFPKEVAQFLEATVSLGAFLSVVPIVCATAVDRDWINCGCCNRPLPLWILVHCALNLLQLPLRACFLYDLHQARQKDTDTWEEVLRLTTSLAWKINKVVSFVAYLWLVLGLVWVMHAGACPLTTMCIFLLVVAVGKFLMSWYLFQYLIPQQEEVPQELDEGQKQGASSELIDSLPLIVHSATETDGQDSCVVCLSEFDVGQPLRQLPCGHKFHRECIDKWLARRQVCPSCLQDIECSPQCGRSSLHQRKVA